MELNEFKEMWEARVESNTLANEYNAKRINQIIMKANSTLDKLHSKNLFWWRFNQISTIILFVVLALSISLFLIEPASHSQLGNVLPFITVITLSSLVSLWLYYEQAKIFDVKDASNMKVAIETSLQRFSRFYSLFNIVNMVMFPILFYIAILLIDRGFFHIKLIFDKTIALQSVLLTLTAMLANHWYYRKKYFTKLAALKDNLKELTEETSN